MPDAVVHGTLPTGAAKEIGATSEGRLQVDADFAETSVGNILKSELFGLQLERNSFTFVPQVLSIAVSCDTAASTAYGRIDWEEVTR